MIILNQISYFFLIYIKEIISVDRSLGLWEYPLKSIFNGIPTCSFPRLIHFLYFPCAHCWYLKGGKLDNSKKIILILFKENSLETMWKDSRFGFCDLPFLLLLSSIHMPAVWCRWWWQQDCSRCLFLRKSFSRSLNQAYWVDNWRSFRRDR